jgi:hypothetical protein
VSLQPRDAIVFSLGALGGILAWFSLLLGLLKKYGPRFDRHALTRAVRVMGILLIGLGIGFAVKAVLWFTR